MVLKKVGMNLVLKNAGHNEEVDDAVQALHERASLPYALAFDVVASIASHHFPGIVDLDRNLGSDALVKVFPFWDRGEKDAFHGQVRKRRGL